MAVNPNIWTPNAMEVGVGSENPDFANSNLEYLKYEIDNGIGALKLNPLGVITSGAILPTQSVTTAQVNGPLAITLPTDLLSGVENTVKFLFTTSSSSQPTISTTGTLKWSDKNFGKAPSAYSTLSGVINELLFTTSDDGANWESEYTAYGGDEVPYIRPNITSNGQIGGSTLAIKDASGGAAWPLLDGDTSNNSEYYFNVGNPVTVYFPEPVKLASISIKNRTDASGYGLASGSFSISRDGVNSIYTASFINSNFYAGAYWDIGIPLANRDFIQYIIINPAGIAGGYGIANDMQFSATHIIT